MQVTDRSGKSEFVNVKWRKPVAMLINGGTRSGKEVLAYGFKKYRLGELIGTRTEGAVLAATAFLIGSGLLLLAVEDVRVDGERLEGVGVTPTIEVQASAASAEPDDPQLIRALAVLSGCDPGDNCEQCDFDPSLLARIRQNRSRHRFLLQSWHCREPNTTLLLRARR
jgi:carboxyl-terminal processing protease